MGKCLVVSESVSRWAVGGGSVIGGFKKNRFFLL